MKLYAFFLSFILVSCGGGGGGSDSDTPQTPVSNPPIIITSNNLVQYVSGDYLTYDYKFNSAFSDGSGAVNVQGQLTMDILPSQYSTAVITTPIKLVFFAEEENGARINTGIGYYGYDVAGSFRKYLLGDLLFTNQTNNDLGSLLISSPLGTGVSWSSTALDYVDSVLYEIATNYSVTRKEIVNTPYGDIEAFNIIYDGTGDETDCIICLRATSFSGVMWVYPSIGIVKFTETGAFGFTSTSKNYNESWSLSGFSVSSYGG